MSQGPNSTGGSSNPQNRSTTTSGSGAPSAGGALGGPSPQTSPTSRAGGPPASGEVTAEAQRTASHLVDRATDLVSAKLTAQKGRAVTGLQGVADALRRTSQTLAETDRIGARRYVEQAANQIDRFSDYVDRRELGEIVDDVEDVARRNPWAFFAGAFALGMLGARFVKSSRASSGTARPRRSARRAIPGYPGQSYPPPTVGRSDPQRYASRTTPGADAPLTLHTPDGVIPDVAGTGAPDVRSPSRNPRTGRLED